MGSIRTRSLRASVRIAAASLIAIALFLPWYLYASPAWQADRIAYSPRVFLLLTREIAGDGYLCSVPLMIAAAAGLRKTSPLITASTAAALIGPLIADGAFGYFFAIRQFLFALPGLVLTASCGLLEISKRSRIAAAALIAAFSIGAVAKSISYFGDRSENWAAAASYLERETAGGRCILFFGPESVALYSLFAPDLRQRACLAQQSGANRIVALAPHASERLSDRFARESAGRFVISVGGTRIAESAP